VSRHRIVAALGAAVIALVTTACGASTPTTEPGAATGTNPGSAAGAWPRTITHAMGTTTIPAQPKRVVALDQSVVDGTVLLETNVVGFTEYRGMKDGLPAYLGEAGKTFGAEATPVGTLEQPNLEAIAALQPDLIVSLKVRHEELYPQLAAIAPTVMGESSGKAWKDNLTWLGESLGKSDVAERKVAAYEKAAKAVGDAIRAKAGDPTISIVRFLDGPTRLYSTTSYSGVVLADAGLARPASATAADGTIMTELSEEKIGLADADKVFVTTYDDEKKAGSTAKARFMANPLWKPIAPKVVEVSDTTWMTAVSLQGGMFILADLAKEFGVEPPAPIA
jgi:iron complex transport system substrate-binding protein